MRDWILYQQLLFVRYVYFNETVVCMRIVLSMTS